MGYALFAQNKLVITAQLNTAQLQQTMKADEQLDLATQVLGIQQQETSIKGSQAGQLAELYGKLAEAKTEEEREDINDEIKKLEQEHQQELARYKAQVYQVSVKEKTVEMEVKRLDTLVTALQEQLQAVQDAEGQGIKNATPKFKGLA